MTCRDSEDLLPLEAVAAIESGSNIWSATVGSGLFRAEESIGRETKVLAARADAVILCVLF
jgi:hypothetical protein